MVPIYKIQNVLVSPSRASLTEIFKVKSGDPPEAGQIWEDQFFAMKRGQQTPLRPEIDDYICQGCSRTFQIVFVFYPGPGKLFSMGGKGSIEGWAEKVQEMNFCQNCFLISGPQSARQSGTIRYIDPKACFVFDIRHVIIFF